MSDQQFDDEIDLGELLLTILGEWRAVATVFVGAVLFSAVYAFAIAPTQYRAEASLRGIPSVYCPNSIACQVTLGDAIADAAALLSTPAGFASLDVSLNLLADDDFVRQGDFAEEKARRRFLDAVGVEASGITAVVSVTHSSDRRAVEIANSIAEFVASEVALRASENYTRHDSDLRLRLAALPSPTQAMSQPEAMITLELSSIEAQLQSLGQHVAEGLAVAVIDRPALLPLEQIAPRRALILALGGVLGMFLGIGAAIVFSMRQGKLHSVGAIAGPLVVATLSQGGTRTSQMDLLTHSGKTLGSHWANLAAVQLS